MPSWLGAPGRRSRLSVRAAHLSARAARTVWPLTCENLADEDGHKHELDRSTRRAIEARDQLGLQLTPIGVSSAGCLESRSRVYCHHAFRKAPHAEPVLKYARHIVDA